MQLVKVWQESQENQSTDQRTQKKNLRPQHPDFSSPFSGPMLGSGA
jgi:hypothetical protein